MPGVAGLAICIAFTMWLFARDRKLRPMGSWGLWVPLLWIIIIGSKSSSYWLGTEINLEDTADYYDGNPVDRILYLSLIVTGCVVLFRRRISWLRVFESNRWLFIFFLYCGISIIWSDYPFISFKRWVKDLGNIVMVLIILTEADPAKAIKAVFARYTYFAIPASVLLITSYPDLGTLYDRVAAEYTYIGITTQKNELGRILVICGLFIIWDFVEWWSAKIKTGKMDLLVRVILMSMLVWLLVVANSVTAILCLPLGAAVLLFLRLPHGKSQLRYLGYYGVTVGLIIFVPLFFSSTLQTILEMLGRDATFTGRTEIWEGLLQEPINPFIGTGYMSFWLGPALGARYGYIIQAHNGYLDTYLNGGLIGLCLLMVFIFSTAAKLKRALLQGKTFAALLFAFLVTALFYDLTEAMFTRLNMVWFVLLMAGLSFPRKAMSAAPVPFRPQNRTDAWAPIRNYREARSGVAMATGGKNNDCM